MTDSEPSIPRTSRFFLNDKPNLLIYLLANVSIYGPYQITDSSVPLSAPAHSPYPPWSNPSLSAETNILYAILNAPRPRPIYVARRLHRQLEEVKSGHEDSDDEDERAFQAMLHGNYDDYLV